MLPGEGQVDAPSLLPRVGRACGGTERPRPPVEKEGGVSAARRGGRHSSPRRRLPLGTLVILIQLFFRHKRHRKNCSAELRKSAQRRTCSTKALSSGSLQFDTN